jgi:hypothetical protein
MIIERIYESKNEQRNLLNGVKDRQCNQAIMAELYADCLACAAGIDWVKVNAAIMKRWPRGLVRIKTQAWKILQQRQRRGRINPTEPTS